MEAEERVKQMEAEASKPMPPSEHTELQRRIEEVIRERDALGGVPRECGVQTAPRPSTPSHQCQVPIFKSCKGGSAHEIANCAMLESLEKRPPRNGEQAEAKRRCFAGGSDAQLPSVVGNRV